MSPKPTQVRLATVCMVVAIWCTGVYWTYEAGRSVWQQHCDQRDKALLQELNIKLSAYREKMGRLPDLNLIELYHAGLTTKRLHHTPYGGYYQIDPKAVTVINPMRSSPSIAQR